jgi:hypothetical protein
MFNLDFDGAVYAVNSESSVVPSPVSTKAFMSVSISLMLVMVRLGFLGIAAALHQMLMPCHIY